MQGSHMGRTKDKGIEGSGVHTDISLEKQGRLAAHDEMKRLPVRFGYTTLNEGVINSFSG